MSELPPPHSARWRRPGAVWGVFALGVALGLALGVRHCRRQRAPTEDRAPTRYLLHHATVMATRIEALLPENQAHLAEQVFRVFREVDARMSEWKPTSPLSAVNRAAGRAAVRVPADLRRVVRRGLELGRRSQGAFDITWAALWGLWDFNAKQPVVPARDQIAQRRQLVDYRDVELDDTAGTLRLKRAGMKIGLGAIAKGYALDGAAVELRKRGAHSFMLSSGGQVLVAGTRDQRPWRVGIRDPRGKATDYFGVLALTDTTISTSGDYEHYFVHDGQRYHHILDPRTGMPARGLRSVTVICGDATLADALSTAVMVLGPDRGLALVEQSAGVEAVLVDDQAQVGLSSGAAALFELKHPPRAR